MIMIMDIWDTILSPSPSLSPRDKMMKFVLLLRFFLCFFLFVCFVVCFCFRVCLCLCCCCFCCLLRGKSVNNDCGCTFVIGVVSGFWVLFCLFVCLFVGLLFFSIIMFLPRQCNFIFFIFYGFLLLPFAFLWSQFALIRTRLFACVCHKYITKMFAGITLILNSKTSRTLSTFMNIMSVGKIVDPLRNSPPKK